MTVAATPRVMSGLPPRTRVKAADVQGGETARTATKVMGAETKPPTNGRKPRDGIAQQGLTRGTIR